MNELIFVEFSLSQKAFHKQTTHEMIKANLETLLSRNQTDYLPIGYFITHDKADAFIKKYYDKFKDYQMYKTTGGETLVPSN